MSVLYALDDPRDHWFGVDKEAHLFGAAFATTAFGVPAAIALSVGVEIVEALRWVALSPQRREAIEAGHIVWPFFTDQASVKDLVADAAGILMAVVVT